MSSRHCCLRLAPCAALVLATLWSPVAAQPAPPMSPGGGAASLLPAEPTWVFNFEATEERSAPDEESDAIASLRQFTYLAVLGYQGDWAQVLNPRTGVTGFVP